MGRLGSASNMVPCSVFNVIFTCPWACFSCVIFSFLNYENMIRRWQETWKTQNKVTYRSALYRNCSFYLFSCLLHLFHGWGFRLPCSWLCTQNQEQCLAWSTGRKVFDEWLNKWINKYWEEQLHIFPGRLKIKQGWMVLLLKFSMITILLFHVKTRESKCQICVWKTRQSRCSDEIFSRLRKFKKTNKEFSKVAKWQVNQKKLPL